MQELMDIIKNANAAKTRVIFFIKLFLELININQ